MLQANGIDFLILEAYPTAAPQVGASIGLLPHGNRILDQLGLYEKVMEIAPPIQTFNFRDTSGQILAWHREMDERIIERHGYPMVFLDRQMLLQVLYNNTKDKSKVLTNKRVVRTELVNGGVHAVTSEGTIFTGDILVGADGVHSTVRSQMWKLAGRLSPGLFDRNEHEGDLHCVFRNRSSYLVTGGPQGRVYWFRFQKLQQKLHGSAIPRYSKKDLQKALSESANDNILPNLKFSTLINNKVSAVMTPLVEYVYKLWHFDRIITLGDSAHKASPREHMVCTSLTYDSSIQWVALKRSPSGRLTTVQVESMFADVQSRRKPRLSLNHRYSHNRANTEMSKSSLLAIALNIQKQELLCEPVSRGSIQWVLVVIYASFAVIAASTRKYDPTFTDRSVPNDYCTDKASILSLESLKVNAVGHFIQPIAIIMIEGYRGRNKLTPLGLPALWLMLIQYAGTGIAMPLYYLVYTLISDVESYWWPLTRFVPLRHARHILSARQTALKQNKILKAELKILGGTYLAAALLGTFCHWFAITQAFRSVDLDMILNFSRPSILDKSLRILAAQHGGLFVYFLASYVWTVQAVWDLNRVGRANMNLFTASLWILLALVNFGPDASATGAWYIREHAMSRTSFQRKQGVKNTQFHGGDAINTGSPGTNSS
ncbi:zeaxanthin epoxidase chloroplastic [Fusarium mundagurra]|uniref:Zeaxanthin epoxidase chloroplastic n=1 Tax=Fusarium mundagurra TaxID=1567541 RepID=A0A8H5YNI6_9HYPO|nr:zeaxanthin epoxidase chloroplastic [Fusarium mundagurra]